MPAGSKTDPPRAKAKPIRDGGSASGVTQLRRGKNCWGNSSRGVRRCERNNSADAKVNGEGGGGGAPGARVEIPLQPMEVHGGADIHLQPMQDPMLEQVDAQRRL
ncbi:E3 ubiquitin-protein ligase MARCHF3 [Grus japonensis]|uniref:E3 ubiquitin-protein ligase MARCHF3 n=1 Tax=Grus japonensis TaxID=30415 RepID=A0ABC9WH02_GRUJA